MHDDRPQTLWQNQPTEMPPLTLEMIREKARRLRAKTRRDLFGGLALALMIVAVSSQAIWRLHGPLPRLALAVSIVWVVAGQYFLLRGAWSPGPPSDSALHTGLENYRREISRRDSLLRLALQWSFGPVILSISTGIVVMAGVAKSRRLSLTAMLPFFTLFVIWIVAYLIQRRRGRRALQREIDELNKSQ